MTQTEKYMTQIELEALIERYFEGETSEAEETALMRELAVTPHRSVAIEEAQAVAGYAAMRKKITAQAIEKVPTKRRPSVAWWISRAAVVAVIMLAGGALFFAHQNRQPTCLAYVNGVKVVAEQEVMELVENDMKSFGETSLTGDVNPAASQLKAIGDVLEMNK